MYRSRLKTTNKTSGKCALIPQVTHSGGRGMTHIELKSSMFPLKPYFFILSQFLTVTGLKKLQVDVLQWQLVQ